MSCNSRCISRDFDGRCFECGSSSNSSACSGADARSADKALTLPSVDLVHRALIARSNEITEEAAVSPRSSDGPAWLDEYERWLNAEYTIQVGPSRKRGDPYKLAVADGLDMALTKFDELRSRAKAK